MIIVTGSATARSDSFEALRQASLDHVHRSRAEPGCISHAVHVDCEDPLRLVFFECWQNMARLKEHFQQPGSAEFMAAVRGLAASSEPIAMYEAGPA
jgi:quinol monooxygenase YgiN